MGVPIEDCSTVASLIGLKTFLTEFVAYKDLGEIIFLRQQLLSNGTYYLYKNASLKLPSNTQMIWNVIN
jgi:nucleoside permease NupC